MSIPVWFTSTVKNIVRKRLVLSSFAGSIEKSSYKKNTISLLSLPISKIPCTSNKWCIKYTLLLDKNIRIFFWWFWRHQRGKWYRTNLNSLFVLGDRMEYIDCRKRLTKKLFKAKTTKQKNATPPIKFINFQAEQIKNRRMHLFVCNYLAWKACDVSSLFPIHWMLRWTRKNKSKTQKKTAEFYWMLVNGADRAWFGRWKKKLIDGRSSINRTKYSRIIFVLVCNQAWLWLLCFEHAGKVLINSRFVCGIRSKCDDVRFINHFPKTILSTLIAQCPVNQARVLKAR